MECPYCSKETDKGEISGDRGVYFFPDNAKRRFGIFPESIKLKGYFGENIIAYYCKDCSKMIINIEKS